MPTPASSPAPKRQAIHAYVEPDTHATWTLFAEDNGVSITGLLEALGIDLGKEIEKAEAEGGDATDIRQDWVRAIRRRRGGS